ncbi:hypothetical protein OG612_45630 (plasmid) [Streptomyces sp. NBC_01527]|uniref:hypothetical protein n=1 Tax=Streptomyces sp. NBC_01527 TaxID=2903894 RepID=UPI002F913802
MTQTNLPAAAATPGYLAVADAIAAAGPGRHYLHIIRPQLCREALAEVLYLGHNKVALGGITSRRFDAVTRLVDAALADTGNQGGSSVLSIVSDLPTDTVTQRTATRYLIEDGECLSTADRDQRDYGDCPAALARAEEARQAEDTRILTTLPERFTFLPA